ncbi:4-hydroxyphenylacetate 3-hydroxylase N-terminal domain-containing protein [Bacillus sp. V5-8f]|uniref:4-hydroxyphenylacetate 3-hydroxylase N-terminal domain-containing protein n=1 Tax=Bacillus sp. V5-8f TaxID=2053044 RepID=UPI000C791DD5|nr:4-hydroxyphenylacetate 3-hydroxylase N-terminal domain-containing protein [Bacillus sp. V5-8f]PLT35951.1 4-hydroxyphenylacetate 3-monooxygenase [Bacillus sp. V5-8f]
METTQVLSKFLKTGDMFKESLRDDRKVYYKGELIPDVTTHSATSGGIDLMAKIFDAQHNAETQDTLTYIRPDLGERVSKAWMIPRTKEDLKSRRELTDYIARETFGVFGRPFDLAPLVPVGMAAQLSKFRNKRPEYAENVLHYIDYAQKNNLMGPEVLVDPQNDRSKAAAAGARLFDDELGNKLRGGDSTPALLRVVKETEEGIYISGAKAVGSISSQGNEMILSNLMRPGLLPEESLWLSVPINAPGIHIICRETVSTESANSYDHPIKSRGEEMDSFLIFDNVFVEKWRIFNYGVPELNELYGSVILGAHWHILSRLAVKAELYAGAAQLIVDALGTGKIPGVRSIVSDVIQYAQTLRAYVLASEELARPTEDEVMWPDVNMLTAGRLHGIINYPQIIHNLQELCGQGLVMRFSEKDYEHPFIGGKLEELLFGRDLTSKQKNLLMNFIWDITTDSHAGRIGLFENVNALPAPLLRERLYHEYDRKPFMNHIRQSIGLPF